MSRTKMKWHYRNIFSNGAYLCIIEIYGIKGGYTAWGETKEDALKNCIDKASLYVKSFEL